MPRSPLFPSPFPELMSLLHLPTITDINLPSPRTSTPWYHSICTCGQAADIVIVRFGTYAPIHDGHKNGRTAFLKRRATQNTPSHLGARNRTVLVATRGQLLQQYRGVLFAGDCSACSSAEKCRNEICTRPLAPAASSPTGLDPPVCLSAIGWYPDCKTLAHLGPAPERSNLDVHLTCTSSTLAGQAPCSSSEAVGPSSVPHDHVCRCSDRLLQSQARWAHRINSLIIFIRAQWSVEFRSRNASDEKVRHRVRIPGPGD